MKVNAFLKDNKFKSYTVCKAKSESFCLVPLFPERLRSHRKCCSELYSGTGSLAVPNVDWNEVKAGQRPCRSSSGCGKRLEVLGWFKMCTRCLIQCLGNYVCIICISMYGQTFLLNNKTSHFVTTKTWLAMFLVGTYRTTLFFFPL